MVVLSFQLQRQVLGEFPIIISANQKGVSFLALWKAANQRLRFQQYYSEHYGF